MSESKEKIKQRAQHGSGEWEEELAERLRRRVTKGAEEVGRDREERDRREALEGIARREAVNHPPHYNQGNIEVIDAIEDWGLDFNSGNVVKYVARHQHKAEPLEDLKKARWYLDRIIEGYEDVSIKD